MITVEVWMLWHGGSSYAVGYVATDTEQWVNLQAAKDEFAHRASPANTYYPCVNTNTQDMGGASAWIWFYDPREVSDPYPDRILSFGPRGGVVCERA